MTPLEMERSCLWLERRHHSPWDNRCSARSSALGWSWFDSRCCATLWVAIGTRLHLADGQSRGTVHDLGCPCSFATQSRRSVQRYRFKIFLVSANIPTGLGCGGLF
jgi:hypothetical protein